MVSLIRFKTDTGDVYVEVGTPAKAGGETLATSAGGVVGQATKSLEQALEPVPKAIKTVLDSITKSEFAPDELEVEFGLKFSADAGVVISKVAGEASITIKGSWKKT